MPIKFDHNPMISPDESGALEEAITRGIGNTEGDFHCWFYMSLGPVVYVVNLRTPKGKLRLEFESVDQLSLNSIRDAVRGAMGLLVSKAKAAGS